ncbi:MAG TPA: hypothetical protein VF576_05755 [Rubricoccaceae bacterium]
MSDLSPRSPGEIAPEVTGFFLEERTSCTDEGRHGIGPPEGANAEVSGLSGRRPLRVERSGLFRVTGATMADTLVFQGEGSPWLDVVYSMTVEEAVESYVRDRRARGRAG